MMIDKRLPVPAWQTGVMDINELQALLASSEVLTFIRKLTRRDIRLDGAHIAFLTTAALVCA